MRLKSLAVTWPVASLVAAGIALAADPAMAQREVTDYGSFDCTANTADGKTTWDCPPQTFEQTFAQTPDVYFSIAGFSKVALPGDGRLSIAVATNGMIFQTGFQPFLDTTLGQAAGADTSTVTINWTAIGQGEAVQRRVRAPHVPRLHEHRR